MRTRLATLGLICAVAVAVWLLWPLLNDPGTTGLAPTPKFEPARVTPSNAVTSPTAAEIVAAQPIPVPAELPGKPVVLSPRRQDKTLIPTRQEVQAMMARARLGLDKEPEWAALIDRLSAVDFRHYPEEYAGVVSEPGWLSNLDARMTGKFRGNDEPAFVEALLARYDSEKTTMRPMVHLEIAGLLNYMTNSPALVPALVRGLESPSARAMGGCANALGVIGTAEAAEAVIGHAKRASPKIDEPDLDMSRRDMLNAAIMGIRNRELVPYLQKELGTVKEPGLARCLKRALKGIELGWPSSVPEARWPTVGL